jgi:hypothetical protein
MVLSLGLLAQLCSFLVAWQCLLEDLCADSWDALYGQDWLGFY